MVAFSPTITPDFPLSYTLTPSVRATKFGDGYEQRQGLGINTQAKMWDITFTNATRTEADYITNFFEARAGVEAFTWTDPEGVTATYKCASWQRSMVAFNTYVISCKFEQRFEP